MYSGPMIPSLAEETNSKNINHINSSRAPAVSVADRKGAGAHCGTLRAHSFNQGQTGVGFEIHDLTA